MRCEETGRWLDLLMDDALDAAQRQALNEHASGCPKCAEQLRSTLLLKAMMKSLPEEAEVPLTAQAAWRGAVRAESKRSANRRLTRMISGAAAAVVVALGIGWALRPAMAPKQNAAMLETGAGAAYESSARDESAKAVAGASYEAAADYELEMADGAMLEADGMIGERAMSAAPETSAPMQSLTLRVEDVQAAAQSIADTAAELEGETALKTIEGVGAHVEVTLPAENAADFLLAVSQWDADPSALALPELGGEGMVTLLLVLES